MSVYATQCPLVKRGNQLVPKFDLSPDTRIGRELRDRYGELIWVLEPNAAPWGRGVMETLRQSMAGFNVERDYLLCLGNPVLMAMMAVYAARDWPASDSQLRFLQWSNGQYLPITVPL